jgi:hypothetical protein
VALRVLGSGVWGLECQLLRRNVKRFRGGIVFKAHRLRYHSTLGSRVLKKKRKETWSISVEIEKQTGFWPYTDLGNVFVLYFSQPLFWVLRFLIRLLQMVPGGLAFKAH